MRFVFHLANCAVSNTPEAKLRESTRMACLAWCLDKLGHEVLIADLQSTFAQSNRYRHFEHIPGGPGTKDDIHVVPAEVLRNAMVPWPKLVAVKCSVGIKHDSALLSRCSVLVAHEYDPTFEDHEKLLKVPFLVHDRVISDLIEQKLFDAYLLDDIVTLRKELCRPKTRLLGFSGAGWSRRKAFCEGAPDWAEIRFYDTHPMGGLEHARWISGFVGGLYLSGDTPKTNTMPLLALLGVAIVCPVIATEDEPPLCFNNCVPFKSWDDVHANLLDEARLAERIAAATADYVYGWSPLGQSASIVRKLTALGIA